jgi:monomeric isocitrate dehydrogenase
MHAGNRKKTEEERLILEHFESVEGSDVEEMGPAANAKRRRPLATSEALDSSHAHSTQLNRIKMYEAKGAASADLFAARASSMAEKEIPLEMRDRDGTSQVVVKSQSSIRAAEEAAFVEMDARYDTEDA